MQAVIIVRRYLKTACASMHATRQTVLFAAVDALVKDLGSATVLKLKSADWPLPATAFHFSASH